jgi:hypothetical protein
MTKEKIDIKMLQKDSQMLGMIANEVEEYCISDECSTLDAVRILKAEYTIMKATKILEEINNKYYKEIAI